MSASRVGQLIALQKPNGCVRDRRWRRHQAAGRKDHVSKIYGVVRESQKAVSICSVNETTTVLSIDGVGAYDLISRRAMLEAVHRMPDGDVILPSVLQFIGHPSTHLWEDEEAVVREIQQGEGGEQGDPLMPALFALGQHQALVAVQETLQATSWMTFTSLQSLQKSPLSKSRWRTSSGGTRVHQ